MDMQNCCTAVAKMMRGSGTKTPQPTHTKGDQMTDSERRAQFRGLHERDGVLVMPNPWDIGSARILASLGFEALATTSAGLAWSFGRLDQQVSRDELVAHTAALARATPLPLNVDSEGCFADEPGGVRETVRLLVAAGAAGCSIEDYDPRAGAILDITTAVERVAEAAEAARAGSEPLVLTARAENHLYGVGDLDDTIERLLAFRDAGADVVYAPHLTDLDQITRVVAAVGIPVNVLALPGAPTVGQLAEVGVRRVSTGGFLAKAAYGTLLAAASELKDDGTSHYAARGIASEALGAAFESD